MHSSADNHGMRGSQEAATTVVPVQEGGRKERNCLSQERQAAFANLSTREMIVSARETIAHTRVSHHV